MHSDSGRHGSIAWLYSLRHQDVPFIPLAAETLTEAGYQVSVYDGSFDREQGIRYRHIPCGSRIVKRSYWPVLSAFIQAFPRRLDLVIASHPDGLLMAEWLKRTRGSRVVYYPFELALEQLNQYSKSPFWRQTEISALSSPGVVDAIVTQNRWRAGVYAQKGAVIEPDIVQNFKSKPVKPPVGGRLRSALSISREKKIVLYEGIIALNRLMPVLIEVSRLLDKNTVLVLMGTVEPIFINYLNEMLAQPDIGQRLRWLAAIPHEDLLDFVSDADVGVLIYGSLNKNDYFCAPGKLSDYVLAGVPVVAPGYPTLRAIVENHGIGVCFEELSPAVIAKAIESVLSKGKSFWQQSIEDARTELVWETQERTLLAVVERVLR